MNLIKKKKNQWSFFRVKNSLVPYVQRLPSGILSPTDDAAAKAVRMENRERNGAESECHPDKDLGKAIRKGFGWRC